MSSEGMDFSEHLMEYRSRLETDYVAAIEAQRFVDELRRDHPDVFEAWMTINAVDFAREAFKHQENSQRQRAIARVGATTFAVAAKEMTEEKARLFSVAFVVDGYNTRRRLPEMFGGDCMFVAKAYARTSNKAKLLALFLQELGKRAGSKKVGEVMSEQQCEQLLRRFFGSDAGPDQLGLPTS